MADLVHLNVKKLVYYSNNSLSMSRTHDLNLHVLEICFGFIKILLAMIMIHGQIWCTTILGSRLKYLRYANNQYYNFLKKAT